MWGALSSILGKRKEEVEEDDDQIDESSIDENDFSESNSNNKTTEEMSTIIKPSSFLKAQGNNGDEDCVMNELKENDNIEHENIKNEEIIEKVIDDNVIDIVVEKQFDHTTATVNQLLTRMVPDADISCPNVIVVGGQSSGKTKMIISMVFHHLIGNKYITDDMGEKLLKLFSTGEKMVTRRPTTIQFKKISESYSCNITIQLGRDKANYTDPEFDEIINKVRKESSTRDGKAYMGELKIEITAPGLPNISFTDLPGLITDNRELSDSEGQSIRQLVQSYMIRKNTTLVVVEPASIEDFETSQVSPLIRSIYLSNERKDIFENSVLVLSKCDKIKDGLEPRIMQIMDLSSPQIKDFPYKHVVGVVNKSESNQNIDTDILNVDNSLTFPEFKKWFEETKKYEGVIFESYLNSNGKPCERNTQCTTAAVFYQMDRISFDMVLKSIQNGIHSIDDHLNQIQFRMKSELAPPLSYYDNKPSKSLQILNNSLSLQQNHLHQDNKLGRYVLIENLKETFDNLLIESFKKIHFKKLFENQDLPWPKFISNDLNISKIYHKTLDLIHNKINLFIDNEIVQIILNVLTNPFNGCFAPCHSKFHRIDRYPKFCQQIISNMSMVLTKSIEITKVSISKYFDNFWEFKIPAGMSSKDILKLFDEVLYITLKSLHKHTMTAFDNNNFINYIYDDILFEEKIEFIELRAILQNKNKNLVNQREILTNCAKETSNERIRNILLLIYERDMYYNNSEHNKEEAPDWVSYSFWEDAENKFLNEINTMDIENNLNENVLNKEHIVTNLSHQKAIKIINTCDGLNIYKNRFDTNTNPNHIPIRTPHECDSPSESSHYSASSTSSSSSSETAHTNMALDSMEYNRSYSKKKYITKPTIKTNHNQNKNGSNKNLNNNNNNNMNEVQNPSVFLINEFVYDSSIIASKKDQTPNNSSYNNNSDRSKLTSPLKKTKITHDDNNNFIDNNNNFNNNNNNNNKSSFSFMDSVSKSPAFKSLFGNIMLSNDDVMIEETRSFSVFNNINNLNENNIKSEVNVKNVLNNNDNNNKDNFVDLSTEDSQ